MVQQWADYLDKLSGGIFVIGAGLVGIGLFGGWWQGDFGNRHTKP